MSRGPYLKPEESAALYRRVSVDGLTVAELARETGRDKSALYRLFNRRFGYKAGHAAGYAWSPTLRLPQSPERLGYLAGIIDGEGSILRSGEGRWSVKVTMTDEPIMEWMGSLGGRLSGPYQPRGNRKPTWTWTVARRRDVVSLLTAVRPLLFVKAARADEAAAELSMETPAA